jgi:YARHG domain
MLIPNRDSKPRLLATILCWILVLAATASADRWEYVGDDVDNAKYYLDVTTTERIGGNECRVWIKKESSSGYSTTNRYSFWSHRKYQVISEPGYRVQDVVPDTMTEAVYYRLFGRNAASSSSSGGGLSVSQIAAIARQRNITDSDLRGASGKQLVLARNAIYAWHGRAFSDSEVRAYFLAQPWYRVNRNYSDSLLSGLEKANAQRILQYQQRNGLTW